MPIDLNLSFGNVKFHLIAAKPPRRSQSSSSSIITARPSVNIKENIIDEKNTDDTLTNETTVIDLTNFSGQLRISSPLALLEHDDNNEIILKKGVDDLNNNDIIDNTLDSKQPSDDDAVHDNDNYNEIKTKDEQDDNNNTTNHNRNMNEQTKKVLSLLSTPPTSPLHQKRKKMTHKKSKPNDKNEKITIPLPPYRLQSPTSLSSSSNNDNNTPLSSSPASTPSSTPTAIKFMPPFHQACANPHASITELREWLRRDPDVARDVDSSFRLPLRILLTTHVVVPALLDDDDDDDDGTNRRRDGMSLLVRDLLMAHPEGILTTSEEDGMMLPFVDVIKDWVDEQYDDDDFIAERKDVTERQEQRQQGLGDRKTTTMSSEFHDDGIPRFISRHDDDTPPPPPPTMFLRKLQHHRDYQFPKVDIPPHVEWCIHTLSWSIEHLPPSLSLSTTLITHMNGTTPDFLKTILLLSDTDIRTSLLSTTLLRHILLPPPTTTTSLSWLPPMIQQNSSPSRRAVDYFHLTSRLAPRDLVPRSQPVKPSDLMDHHHRRKTLLRQLLERSDELLPMFVTMTDDRLMERVGTTSLVKDMLNDVISRPFVVSVCMIDLVLHVTLMILFRSLCFGHGVTTQLGDGVGAVFFPSWDAQHLMVAVVGCHFLLRMGSDFVAMGMISGSLLRRWFWDVWNMVKFGAVVMVLVTARMMNVGEERLGLMPNLLSVTMALLWISLLGFLKVVNSKMSVYILAIGQIVKDIFWFLAILIIILFMFADMVHIAKAEEEGYCLQNTQDIPPLNDGDQPNIDDYWRTDLILCSNKLIRSYLHSVTLLIGSEVSFNENYENANEFNNMFLTILLVIFLVLIIVILLNILIAIVTESYEKSQVRKEQLFGRARLFFAVEHIALEKSLSPPRSFDHDSDDNDDECDNSSQRRSAGIGTLFARSAGHMFRVAVLLSIIVTSTSSASLVIIAMVRSERTPDSYTAYYYVWFVYLVMLLLCFVLAMSLIVIIKYTMAYLGCITRGREMTANILLWHEVPFEKMHDSKFFRFFYSGFRFMVNAIGINPDKQQQTDDEEEETYDHEWMGRLNFIEEATGRIVSDSEVRVSEKMKVLEERIVTNDMAVKDGLRLIIAKLSTPTVSRSPDGRL